MKSLEIISNEITALEAERDFGDITPEGFEQLAVLNLCYDLLSRTKTAQAITVPTPPEMMEPGFESDTVQVYGITSSQLANFSFAIATRQGQINMKGLFIEITSIKNQNDLAESSGTRQATISDYKRGKKTITVQTYQNIINAAIKQP
jgi:hypothetical protein